jgi:predicted nucleic acid-binding protein
VNVLVDTSVWSLALRRKSAGNPGDAAAVAELGELIGERRVEIVGPIRQEVLSGISDRAQFTKLRDKLAAFADLPLDSADYVRAAEFHNECRRRGIAGSHGDFVICAAAARHRLPIFTTDGDFTRYADCLALTLHRWRRR